MSSWVGNPGRPPYVIPRELYTNPMRGFKKILCHCSQYCAGLLVIYVYGTYCIRAGGDNRPSTLRIMKRGDESEGYTPDPMRIMRKRSSDSMRIMRKRSDSLRIMKKALQQQQQQQKQRRYQDNIIRILKKNRYDSMRIMKRKGSSSNNPMRIVRIVKKRNPDSMRIMKRAEVRRLDCRRISVVLRKLAQLTLIMHHKKQYASKTISNWSLCHKTFKKT